jgi:transposase-like protein
MANLYTYNQHSNKRQLRTFRYFSEDFKRKKVKEVERNVTSVAAISQEYGVTRWTVYKWIYKYSTHMKKGIKQVVEAKSDTIKIKQLKDQIKELERIIGQKQILIDFQEKMIELAENEYQLDIKKKFGSKPLSGSGQTGKNTPTS